MDRLITPTHAAIVQPEDSAEAIQVLSQAFNRDPVWSSVFPNSAHRQAYWRLLVNGGARYPWTFRTPGFEAVSVWVPPEGGEFLPEDEVDLPAIVRSWVGAGSERVLEVFRRFDSGHPREQRHYYLGLLGTRDSARGHGHGMALLSENLAQIDREHSPAYLESTNPLNVRKYQALGFETFDRFQVLDDGPWVDRMWRPAR